MISRCDTARASHKTQSGREAGFTLIEVIVTLTILGLALALIAGYKAPWSTGLGLRGTAAQIAEGLRQARSEAILRNEPVAFEIDTVARHYRVGSGPVRPLPPRLTLDLLTIAGEQRTASTGGIRFNPDGSSSGGRIVVSDGGTRMAVGVEWINGRVSVADAR